MALRHRLRSFDISRPAGVFCRTASGPRARSLGIQSGAGDVPAARERVAYGGDLAETAQAAERTSNTADLVCCFKSSVTYQWESGQGRAVRRALGRLGLAGWEPAAGRGPVPLAPAGPQDGMKTSGGLRARRRPRAGPTSESLPPEVFDGAPHSDARKPNL
jgi:hypothetical protein